MPLKRRVVQVRIQGHAIPFYVRLGSTDWMVLDELFITCEYDRILGLQLGPVHRILDLGANVGYSARLWHEFFPEASITCVEPDADNRRICALNAEQFASKFKMIPALVGAASGTAYLDRSCGDWGIRIAEPGAKHSDEQAVPVITMPEILEETNWASGVDFLKCDIEGAEWKIFGDCRHWIGRIQHILIELHGGRSVQEFQEILRSNGADFDHCVWQAGEGYALVFLSRK